MADKQLSKTEIEELRSLIKLLDHDIDNLEFENLVKSGEAARTLLKSLQKEAIELTSDISGIVSIFQGIVSEIKRINLGVDETTKSFKSLTSIAQKIQYHQSEISKLTEKDIKKIKEKLDQEKINLVNADKLLKAEAQRLNQDKLASDRRIEFNERERKVIEAREERLRRSGMRLSQTDKERLKELGKEHGRLITQQEKINKQLQQNADSQGNIKGIIDEQDGAYNTLEATLIKINRQLKDQEKLLGLGGAIIGSLETALGKLGLEGLTKALGIPDAKEEMQSLSEKIIKDKEKQLILENDIAKGIDAQTGQPYDPAMLQAKQEELAALTASNAQYDGMNGKVKILRAGISSMGKSLITNLKDPLSIAVFLTTQLFDAFKSADAATGDLAKGMNMTYNNASALRQEMNQIANLSMDAAVTTKGMQESYMAIGHSIGAEVDMNKANLVLMTQLREKAGLTNDEFISMSKIAAATGENVEDATKGFLGGAQAVSIQAGKALNVKQLMKETANVSNAIKLSIKGGAEGLGEAAAKAKLMGMNLQQADKIAGSLLNFEDSINAELEAELLTGKDLNLEAARLAAINGDMGKLTEEISKNIGSSADFTKMNRLQQEALAKAVGMTREELADTLVEQEALKTLGRDLTEEERSAFELAKEKYGADKARKMLGQGQLEDMMKQQSIQDRFNQTIEKLREIFVSIADPILQIVSPFVDVLSPVLSVISGILGTVMGYFGGILKFITPIVAALGIYLGITKGILLVQQGINAAKEMSILLSSAEARAEALAKAKKVGGFLLSIGEYALNAGIAVAKIPFVGPILAVAAIAAAVAGGFALYNKFNKAGDMSSPSDGKTRVSTKEGGLFELSPNDDFAAAPGLLDNLNKPAEAYAVNASNGNGGNAISNTEMIAIMREILSTGKEQIKATKEIANQPVNINMDGEKVGEKSTFGVNNKNNKTNALMQ